MEENKNEQKSSYTINEDLMKTEEVDDQKDYFAHIKNEDFVIFFEQLLALRMEVTNFNYPYEEFLEDDGIADHIGRCQGILFTKIKTVLENARDDDGNYLEEPVIKSKYNLKRKEIIELIAPVIDKYLENVKVIYVDLTNTEIIFIPDYPGEVENKYEDITDEDI